MPPRFDAQRFFLTYSQIDLNTVPLNLLLEHLNGINNVEWTEGNTELHADGGRHHHAIIIFDRRFRGQMDAFDFAGAHPNVKVIKSGKRDLQRVRTYIRKDGLDGLLGLGIVPAYDPHDAGAGPAKCNPWSDIVDCATKDEFMVKARALAPKEYVLRHFDLLNYCQLKYNTVGEYVSPYDRDSFVVPEAIDEWITSVFGEVCLFRLGHPNLPHF